MPAFPYCLSQGPLSAVEGRSMPTSTVLKKRVSPSMETFITLEGLSNPPLSAVYAHPLQLDIQQPVHPIHRLDLVKRFAHIRIARGVCFHQVDGFFGEGQQVALLVVLLHPQAVELRLSGCSAGGSRVRCQCGGKEGWFTRFGLGCFGHYGGWAGDRSARPVGAAAGLSTCRLPG